MPTTTLRPMHTTRLMKSHVLIHDGKRYRVHGIQYIDCILRVRCTTSAVACTRTRTTATYISKPGKLSTRPIVS